MNKKYALVGLCLLCVNWLRGQPKTALSLLEAYELLENRYPALNNADILDEIYAKELDQLDRSRLPRLYLKADGRLQSESTQLDAPEGAMLPFEINQPLVALKTYAEAQYNILDGGTTEAQKKLKQAILKAEQQNIAVDRFALRKRIDQLFVQTIMLREQSKLFDLSLEDIKARKAIISAGIEYGTILESERIKLEVKELELNVQKDNLAFRLSGLLNTLAQLLDVELAPEVILHFPNLASPVTIPPLNRPEQQLFQVQSEAILAQSDWIEAQGQAKLSAYTQAGVGYPNPLNILDNNIAPFGIIGAQFSWQITDWKKSETDKELLHLHAQKLHHAKETFEFNLKAKEANFLAEINRLQNQIEQDKTLAQLQSKLLQQLSAQLDEGVITSTEYVLQVNAELKARQNLLIHETELFKTQLEFWSERGGF